MTGQKGESWAVGGVDPGLRVVLVGILGTAAKAALEPVKTVGAIRFCSIFFSTLSIANVILYDYF